MTLDQLKRRGFSLGNRCCFCGDDEENIEHLLIYCPKFQYMDSVVYFGGSLGHYVGDPSACSRLYHLLEQTSYEER